LKNTCAIRITQIVPIQLAGRMALKARPTTTVGSTNGTVTKASRTRRPGRAYRFST